MKILYFHQHFSTPDGATGIRSYEMARYLVSQKNQVTMVCGSYGIGNTGLTSEFVKGKRRGMVDGIDVIEFDLNYSNDDGFLKRVFTFLKYAVKSTGLVFTEEYDLLFATTTPLTAGIPGIIAKVFRRKPFVFEVRDLWPELPKAMGVIKNPFILKAMSVLEWLSYKTADRIIGLAPGIVEGIKQRSSSSKQVSLVPNGCDLDLFSPSKLQSWQPDIIKQTDFVALFAGSHGHANGLDAVLDAAVILKQRQLNNIKILLVGSGKLKSQLQTRAKKNGLDNVLFHEPINKLQLASLMKRANIGLQILANIPAFYYGTSPNKFFDYIAAGLPVLNNYPGWVSDLINQANCGYVVDADNPSAFADALEIASTSNGDLKEMSFNARQLAEQQFDRKLLAQKWSDCVCGVS